MNITDYRQKDGEKRLYTGRMSVKEGFYIGSADEYSYYFLGDNSCFTIKELIHPEDLESFVEALDQLDQGEQCLLLRVRAYNNRYRWLYAQLSYNGKVFDGFRSFDIVYSDVMYLSEKYNEYVVDINKYRRILMQTQQIFFEYKYEKDEFVLYTYVDSKAKVFYRASRSELEGLQNQGEKLTEQERANFDAFCNCITNGVDGFKVRIAGKIFANRQLTGVYDVLGSTLYLNGTKTVVMGVFKNDTKIVAEDDYYMSEAARDSGTGLMNKRAISRLAMEKLAEKPKQLYFLMIDIDDFKKVNDTYGHMFGDEVISKVSECIRSVVGARGMAGRFGGDEFFVVLSEVQDEYALRKMLRTLFKNVNWAYRGDKQDVNLTMSVGISRYPDNGTSYEELFKLADKSLYIAKAKGKNRFIVYDEKKHGEVQISNEDGRTIGLGATLNDEKKIQVVSELVLDLHTQGLDCLQTVLEKIREYFDVDGVAVYQGKELKRTVSVGRYINPIEHFPYHSSDEIPYCKRFDSNGIYAETNFNVLRNSNPTIFEVLDNQETREFIQVFVSGETGAELLISFDVFNRTRKWSDNDKNYLTIIGKLIGKLLQAEA